MLEGKFIDYPNWGLNKLNTFHDKWLFWMVAVEERPLVIQGQAGQQFFFHLVILSVILPLPVSLLCPAVSEQ